MDAGIIEFVSSEQVLLVKLKNVSAHLAQLKQWKLASILNLFLCNPSFGVEEFIFDQNLKTLTFAFPLEQCAVHPPLI